VDDAHLVGGEMECGDQLVFDAEGSLRSGPDRKLAILPLGNCGSWFERSVRDVLDGVRALKSHGALGNLWRSLGGGLLLFAATWFKVRLQILEEILIRRLPGRDVPLRVDLCKGFTCGPCIWCDYSDEVAVADDLCSGHFVHG